MGKYSYQPILELTRGRIVESLHYGAFAVVNSQGESIMSYGDPNAVTFLRSSAKPFQALPFIEENGHIHFGFSLQEIAITCASHSGTNEHFQVLTGMQAKINITQDDLLCGIHPPVDLPTKNALLTSGEEPTPNRHNCSGKHTGMLAHARLLNVSIDDYINPDHPIQKRILNTFCDMCKVDPKEVDLGVDGCSAPVFAIPLWNAAMGYARICDPIDQSEKRVEACRTITKAMTTHPEMVSGPGKFDTRLMAATKGKIVSKGGAEGFQQIGIMPNVIKPGSPGIGIALKISDGDRRGIVRPSVILEILQTLKAISPSELTDLTEFGPKLKVKNWRNIVVGESYPTFRSTK